MIGGAPGANDRRVSAVGDPSPLGYNAGSLAAMLDPGFEADQQPYCLLYRLTWLIPGSAIRAEVEVSWPLDVADIEAFMRCDTMAANQLDQVRSVTLTTTISVNLFRR